MNRILIRGKLFKDWKCYMIPVLPKWHKDRDSGGKQPMAVNTILDRYGGVFTYVDVALFGKLAEVAMETTVKGDQVEAKGFLKMSTWTDKTTGLKRSKLAATIKAFEKLSDSKEWDIGPNEMAPWEAEEEGE